MKSTMQDVPLTVAGIVRHASAVHGDRDVLTARGPGQISRVSYRGLGERPYDRLAYESQWRLSGGHRSEAVRFGFLDR